ncbi:MAG: protein-L-isoaspartate(D-aspartate) O-methyltransferase [Rhodobacteraceae bacterium HLUCCA24]|nr:MAG: protein-L-isoaspartate(D-aspartate) O-methyltransferase [Rhodobacteraceae bacterium HLUCCA24]
MIDFATRRVTMVDTQIRPADVTKFPVIEAMLDVPRELFVPEEKREAAYVGDNIDIGGGRVILEPRTLAKMLDEIDLQPDDLVLDLGSAYGYSAAVAAYLAEAVVAVEEDAALLHEAQSRLADYGADNVALHHGPLVEGAPEHGPYDAILVQGAVGRLPEAVAAQLKEGGRIACLFDEGRLGTVRVGYKVDGALSWRFAFNAGAPVLPGFEQLEEFTL